MKAGSLFSGVGGFDMGLERAGMEVVWQVEYDEQAQSILRRHWPDAALHKDVCDVGRSNLAPVSCIAGGFPCQDLSVAGRRAGLAGERSGLFHEFMRIVDELAPRWVLIENVPGLLSSNEGRDMGVVVGTLGDLGYGWTYRVLDSQYFGVAQRRRRVFIVGHSGGFCPPEVLLEPESVSGDPAPSREAGKGAAGESPFCFSGQSLADTPYAFNAYQRTVDGKTAYPVQASGGRKLEKGVVTKPPLVAFDTTQITSKLNRSNPKPGDPCHPVAAGAHPPAIAPQSLAIRGRGGVPQAELGTDGKANALLTPNGGRGGVGAGAVLAATPRRLTPRECERLQGFPDDHTAWGIDPDGNRIDMADGPRYRMLGNAVTVSVAEWIGRRIIKEQSDGE